VTVQRAPCPERPEQAHCAQTDGPARRSCPGRLGEQKPQAPGTRVIRLSISRPLKFPTRTGDMAPTGDRRAMPAALDFAQAAVLAAFPTETEGPRQGPRRSDGPGPSCLWNSASELYMYKGLKPAGQMNRVACRLGLL
jgi:hypothetical protein